MLKKQGMATVLISLGLCANTAVMANVINVHGLGGVAITDTNQDQFLDLGSVTNQFNTNIPTQTNAVWGFGLGYQWDVMFKNQSSAFGLDLTAYTMKTTLSGVQTPAVNLIANADTLNYSAKDTSWAIMVEPKLMSTAYPWQPYVVGGIGYASNKMNNYSECPTYSGSSAVAVNTFANNTTSAFAWEIGVGVQHNLYTSAAGRSLVLAGEYRYMDWGQMNLGTTPSQTTTQGLNFGRLSTNNFDLKLSLQF